MRSEYGANAEPTIAMGVEAHFAVLAERLRNSTMTVGIRTSHAVTTRRNRRPAGSCCARDCA